MANENETEPEEDLEPAEGEVNWEERARNLEEKAKVSREKRKELKDSYEKQLADKEAELKVFKSQSQPTGPDYGKLAFLQTKGIDHPDDIQVVENEANRLKLALTDILAMKHIQDRLKENKETRTAELGITIDGSNRSSNATKNQVDYCVAKGGLPADQDLAAKVVNARMTKDQGSKFADEMFNE